MTRPPSSTTIGCNVSGTGVNGSGMLTCAATAVNAAMNTTAAARIAPDRSRRAVNVVSSTGGQNRTVTSASRRTGTRSGPDRICSLVSMTTAQPDTQALYISEMLPS